MNEKEEFMILICNSGKAHLKNVSTLLKYMYKSIHMSMKSHRFL